MAAVRDRSRLRVLSEDRLSSFREHQLIAFDCECGALHCNAKIEMTLAERDAIDHGSHEIEAWAIAPDHKVHVELGERVLERHERYWIVG
jgi:hypothetical protein